MKNNIVKSQFKVEKNVPIPALIRRPCAYPFAQMKVGDSFFVPQNKVTKSLACSAQQYARVHNLPFRFSVRKVEGGMRVWAVNRPVPPPQGIK